jgi:hypothetical protein
LIQYRILLSNLYKKYKLKNTSHFIKNRSRKIIKRKAKNIVFQQNTLHLITYIKSKIKTNAMSLKSNNISILLKTLKFVTRLHAVLRGSRTNMVRKCYKLSSLLRIVNTASLKNKLYTKLKRLLVKSPQAKFPPQKHHIWFNSNTFIPRKIRNKIVKTLFKSYAAFKRSKSNASKKKNIRKTTRVKTPIYFFKILKKNIRKKKRGLKVFFLSKTLFFKKFQLNNYKFIKLLMNLYIKRNNNIINRQRFKYKTFSKYRQQGTKYFYYKGQRHHHIQSNKYIYKKQQNVTAKSYIYNKGYKRYDKNFKNNRNKTTSNNYREIQNTKNTRL